LVKVEHLCRILIEERGCDLVMALGMPGPKPIDRA